jgi:hypothetical protein
MSTFDKQRDLKELMALGVVMLHLDPRRPGVELPAGLRAEPKLQLNFNHVKGAGDLVADVWGVRETLRFGGVWTPTAIPWSAIFAMSVQGEEVRVYAEDLPLELVETAMQAAASGAPAPTAAPRRGLQLVYSSDTVEPVTPPRPPARLSLVPPLPAPEQDLAFHKALLAQARTERDAARSKAFELSEQVQQLTKERDEARAEGDQALGELAALQESVRELRESADWVTT